MARSIWSGVITFGMVSIPVKLYTATESKDVTFHLLHKECDSRLKQLRWCPPCERAVEWEETVRGFEYARDEHVILADGDFEKLPLPSKRAVQLSAFVPACKIDPIYYERIYYLEPETGVKAFALLMRALTKKRLVAVAKIAIRNKEQLCCLRPYAGALLLETMFYADEIRVAKDQEQQPVKVSEQELGMAFTFIDLLSEPFDAAKYSDGYREALTAIIEAKLRGQEIVEPAPVPVRSADLMTALKASIKAAAKRKQLEQPTGRLEAV